MRSQGAISARVRFSIFRSGSQKKLKPFGGTQTTRGERRHGDW